MATSNTTIYFGYGSNLWRKQMHQRCPNSTYLGIARLNDYEWLINERGYANVVEIEKENQDQSSSPSASELDPSSSTPILSSSKDEQKREEDYKSQVWGLVYSLQPSDEARLDKNEGVPFAYGKETLECDFWPVEDSTNQPVNVSDKNPEKIDMLVYINREAVTPSKPKREYVYRMNMGIRDAVREGVPEGYVGEVMRRFIPEMDDEGGLVEVAERQGLEFEDERL